MAAAAAPAPEAIAAHEQAAKLMSEGDPAQAEQDLKELAARYPQYAGPMINLAILQTRLGRLSDAEAALTEALQRNPQSAPAHNQLGILYRKLGRFQDADQAYQQALSSDPSYPLAHLNLGVLCDLYLEQPQRALQHFERYLQLEAAPQPQVRSWVKELRSRLGVREQTQAEPAAQSPPSESESGAST